MLLALALATAMSATPRVLIVGTRFDDVDDGTRARITAAAEEAFIAARCTVRLSNCRDEKCAEKEAAQWKAGAVVYVSAARLGGDVSVALRAVSNKDKALAKSDTLVDAKKLSAVNTDIEKYAAKLRPQIPITSAPDAPVAPMPEPEVAPPSPAPSPESIQAAAVVTETPPAKKSAAAGIGMLAGAAALLVASIACLSLALLDDGRLASSRMVGNDGVGRWVLTRDQADSLRSTAKLELVLGGALGGVGLALGVIALAVW